MSDDLMTDDLDLRILLIGYGNPGRRDDGLGPRLADEFEALGLPHLTVQADYQLTVEHAHAIAEHDVVIFADAAVSGPAPFRFERIAPGAVEPGFSTHHLEPATMLGLARDLFGARPRGCVLGIRGYAFDDFGEELSPPALRNLAAAAVFLGRLLTPAAWTEVVREAGRSQAAQVAQGDEELPCKTESL